MAKERSSNQGGDFQQLLMRAHEDDRQVLKALDLFRTPLRRYGEQHFPQELKGKIDVSDLIQETLLKGWQSFPSFQGKTKKVLCSWLLGIMRHVINTRLREFRSGKRDVRREVPLPRDEKLISLISLAGLAFPSEEETKEEVGKFQTVFRRLTQLHRHVLYLRNYKKMTYKEVASQLGRTEEGARKLHDRALKRFLAEWERSKE